MRRRRLKRGEGYTFIELLIAVTVLAILTPPLLSLLAGGFIAVNSAGQQTAAVNYARAAMESLKAAGYDTHTRQGLPSVAVSPLPQGFQLKTALRDRPADADPSLQGLELLQIEVTVSWKSRDMERSVTLESYLANR